MVPIDSTISKNFSNVYFVFGLKRSISKLKEQFFGTKINKSSFLPLDNSKQARENW
jgi:hypothetical protein